LIFRYHPHYRDTPVIHDPLESAAQEPLFIDQHRPRLEGGDVLVLSEDVVAIGLSQRTNRNAIYAFARALTRREAGPRWLIAVALPKRRAYMHLDTVVTPIDRDACLVYAPVMLPEGAEPVRVFAFDLHRQSPEPVAEDGFLPALQARGIDYEPIACGGRDPLTQQREQWTDGANALALAPGVITLYERNQGTAEELSRHGFSVARAEDLLLGRETVNRDAPGRLCLLIPSHEISRARGGPHCLTHPLRRAAL
jgi:arginine deiminase